MISQKLQDAINNQIQNEFYSSYLYLSMAAYCEENNFPGFAHWLRLQYQEETQHAIKFIDYLHERGGSVKLQQLAAPPAEFGTPLRVFEQTLAHEQHITALIHQLYETALAEKDYAAQIFLQWFITEQVEEEASVTAIVERLRTIGDKSPGSILYVDKELRKRV